MQRMVRGEAERAVGREGMNVAPAEVRAEMEGAVGVRFQIVRVLLALRKVWARAVPMLPRPMMEISVVVVMVGEFLGSVV
jgi:hypothetical protein